MSDARNAAECREFNATESLVVRGAACAGFGGGKGIIAAFAAICESELRWEGRHWRATQSNRSSLPLTGRLWRFGGGKGIRTPGLLIANETLYQLSYTPGEAGRE